MTDHEPAPASAVGEPADELPSLQAAFPCYRIWREAIGDRVRYSACRRQPGLHLHTVVTGDLGEMRAALESARYAALIPFSPGVPNIARMYDFFIGGKDHLQADRAAARAILRRFPVSSGATQAARRVVELFRVRVVVCGSLFRMTHRNGG